MALILLLDTNAYSDLKRGVRDVADAVRRAEEVLLSSIVAGELLYRFRRGSRMERNMRDLEDFISRPYVSFLPVTWVTCDRYARVAAALRRQGTPIPSNDIWIAAHALEAGADLLSRDTHFAHIDGLAWINP